MIANFPHTAPNNYCYEFKEFKRNIIAIWLRCDLHFDYNNGVPTCTIWGFYNQKTNEYFAPINSKTIGARVNIKDTRNYTSMSIKQSPLDAFFV